MFSTQNFRNNSLENIFPPDECPQPDFRGLFPHSVSASIGMNDQWVPSWDFVGEPAAPIMGQMLELSPGLQAAPAPAPAPAPGMYTPVAVLTAAATHNNNSSNLPSLAHSRGAAVPDGDADRNGGDEMGSEYNSDQHANDDYGDEDAETEHDDDDDDNCSETDASDADSEHPPRRAKAASKSKPKAKGKGKGGLLATSALAESTGSLPFVLQSGAAVLIPVVHLDQQWKPFLSYFRTHCRGATKTDEAEVKQFRRRYQLRKSSKRGRDEQRQRQRTLERQVQEAARGSIKIDHVLAVLSPIVHRFVDLATSQAMLTDMTAALALCPATQ